jgi:CRISPR-associated protein Csb3
MNTKAPSITLELNLRNPGQFLACCGLLELASRLDPEARGWFGEEAFHLAHQGPDLWRAIRECDIRTVPAVASADVANDGKREKEPKSPPIELGGPFNLRLDWWEEESATEAGFKTWSGGQTVMGFLEGMRSQLPPPDRTPQTVLTDTLPLRKPKPFYFDCRLSRFTSLDMGFSTEHFTAAFSPAVELLALVGLQRFRPAEIERRETYAYCSWSVPLYVRIAAAVAHGLLPSLLSARMVFPLVFRTGGKYKAFGPATFDWRHHG